MKKLFVLALSAFMFAANADAQKQTGGEKNLQVFFAPVTGSPVVAPAIAFRKFNAAGNSAWRLFFQLGMSSETKVLFNPDADGSYSTAGTTFGGHGAPERDEKTSEMAISLRPGYEKHFAGTERLSPYWGVEAMITMVTKKVTTDTLVDNSNATTAASDWLVLTKEKKGDGASTTFGLNLIAGFDYYFAKSLSIGAEFGWGLAMSTMPDIESERFSNVSSTGTQEAWSVKEAPAGKQGKSMDIAPQASFGGKLKLAWLFGK